MRRILVISITRKVNFDHTFESRRKITRPMSCATYEDFLFLSLLLITIVGSLTLMNKNFQTDIKSSDQTAG